MTCKPITPKIHGINDYLFSTVLFIGPHLIGLNRRLSALYSVLGINLFLYNAFTNQPVAIKKMIPYHDHLKLDCINVATLGLLTFYKPIKNNRKAGIFHIAFVSLAIINVLLTDWEKSGNE